MSDDGKCYAATPAATLEEHIINSDIAKSETEWWAHHEITRLRSENEKLRARAVLIPESVEKIIDDYPAVCAERDRMRALLVCLYDAAGPLDADKMPADDFAQIITIVLDARAAIEGVTEKSGAGNE